MHHIRKIDATIQVDDLNDGYEINNALTALLDGEMEIDLEKLFDAHSNSDYVTIYDQMTLNILLESADQPRNTLKQQILQQIESNLIKHEFNQESKVVSDINYDNNSDSNANINEQGVSYRELAVSTYFIENLLQFFKTGAITSLSDLSHEDLQQQIINIIEKEQFYLVDQLSFHIKIDKSILYRIINFFSLRQIRLLIKFYAKKIGLSLDTFERFESTMFQLFPIKSAFAEKIILFNSLIFIHENKSYNVNNELYKLEEIIKSYHLKKELSSEIGMIAMSEFKLLVDSNESNPFIKMISNIQNYLSTAADLLISEKSSNKDSIKSKEVLDKLRYFEVISDISDQEDSAEFTEDYINYLINTFKYIIVQGSYPYWISTEPEVQNLFKEALKLLLVRNKRDIRSEIVSIFSEISFIPQLIKSLNSHFDFETRFALLNVLDEETSHKLDIFQHLFVKFKGLLQKIELVSPHILSLINKGFNSYKSEITEFLMIAQLTIKTSVTVKQLFALFIIKSAQKEKESEKNIRKDLKDLFSEKDEIDLVWALLEEQSVNISDVAQKTLEDPQLLFTRQNQTLGLNLKVDLEFFIKYFIPEYKKNISIESEKLSFESLKKTYLSLGQIDHYNLPEDIRTFYFRALQTKDANQKYEWAYFIFRLFKSEFEGTYSKDVQETLSIKTAQPQVGSASKSIDEAPEKYLDRTQLLDASIQVVYRNFLDAVNEINDIRVKSGVNPETIGKIIKLLSKIYKQSFNEFDRAIQYVKEFSLPEHLVKLNEVIPGKKINEYKLKSEWHTLLSEAHIILLDEILFLKNNTSSDNSELTIQEKLSELQEIYHKQIEFNKVIELSIGKRIKDEQHYDELLFQKLRDKFNDLIIIHGKSINTAQSDELLNSIGISELFKISPYYNSKSSFDNNLKQIIIQLSKQKNIPIRSILASILKIYFQKERVPSHFEGNETIYYQSAFSIFELFIQSLTVDEKRVDPTESRSEYSPTNIPMGEAKEHETFLVSNAGLVICGPFISMLFQRLDLLNEKKEFKDNYCLNRAVFILNYLSYGTLDVKEYHLSLNNVLCNVPKNFIYDFSIKLTKKERDTCDSLLENICQQWSALKSTSPDGLRYNFLIRDGSLSFDGAYKLVVAKKPYDLLLSRIPWTIGTMKLPWMKEFLFTEWE
ncbi:MAG: hypothetical protein IPI15_00535 [Saprospiraceae bacterium]|uniref:contractile injection system tape measure protein n=1 Tax=Candidatus Brachybacter algidus TaxID=2982024 RepID=UPI00257AA064|nr:contractile injection system tape measure protein [Candidatus Brachybacter algidus]MBK7602073.1 hypothetical protein [Candidatus Brachybacter algidus]